MNVKRRTLLIAGSGFLAASAGPFKFASLAMAQEVDKDELMKAGPLGEMAIGPEDAPVTIIEYASATCPHCANFHAGTFKELKEKYIDQGKVRFIFREFPFDDLSLAAFMLARCAPEDKFFPMIDILFAQQSAWTSRDANARDELFKIARLAGFSQEKFDECIKNVDVAKGIIAVRDAGQKLGVQSTPTFFVNGEKVSGNLPLSDFEELMKPHLG